jgi:surfactin synthase thioesterase subunit
MWDDDAYVTWHDPAQAVIDLVCIPHGAAEAGHYRKWADVFPPRSHFEWSAFQDARVESASVLSGTSTPCSRLLAPALERCARPIALFGLCSGAIIAFELTHRMREAPLARIPVELFVAAQAAPSVLSPHHIARKLGGTDPVTFMATLGETDDAVLASPELMEMIAPALEAISRYCAASTTVRGIRCRSTYRCWQEWTTRAFTTTR